MEADWCFGSPWAKVPGPVLILCPKLTLKMQISRRFERLDLAKSKNHKLAHIDLFIIIFLNHVSGRRAPVRLICVSISVCMSNY